MSAHEFLSIFPDRIGSNDVPTNAVHYLSSTGTDPQNVQLMQTSSSTWISRSSSRPWSPPLGGEHTLNPVEGKGLAERRANICEGVQRLAKVDKVEKKFRSTSQGSHFGRRVKGELGMQFFWRAVLQCRRSVLKFRSWLGIFCSGSNFRGFGREMGPRNAMNMGVQWNPVRKPRKCKLLKKHSENHPNGAHSSLAQAESVYHPNDHLNRRNQPDLKPPSGYGKHSPAIKVVPQSC